MKTKRLILSWLVCAIVMFSLFYAWHGLLLNDFERISFPRSAYLTMSAFVYLLLGFIVSRAYMVDYLDKFTKAPLLKGAITGSICGFILYIFALVIGVSFGGRSLENIIIDVVWQVIEQGAGGAVVGYIHYLAEMNGWFMSPHQHEN